MTFEERVRRLLEDRLAELRATGDRYRAERDRYGSAESRRNLSDEYRRELIATERTKAIDGIRAARDEMAQVKAEIEADIARARAEHQPSGAEAVAARIEAADARSRVRELLQRASVSDVLARAETNRDRTMLEALRDEVTWIELDRPTLGDALAKALGHEDDTRPAPADAVQRRIDRAMLPLLPQALADAVEAELTLAEGWPVVELLANAADEHIESPTGTDIGTAIAAKVLAPAPAAATTAEEGAA